jgi:6,7-dimethyl-8-ribityllumazine synthase
VSDRVAVVVSRFNEDVTAKLRDRCLSTLKAHGVAGKSVRVVEVPGGYELPWTVNELARSKRYAVVIALGCILKGSTPQNDHIARSTVQKLHEISLATRVPVILGVLTPNTYAQAVARTKGALDRGAEAAHAALAMLKVRKELSRGA